MDRRPRSSAVTPAKARKLMFARRSVPHSSYQAWSEFIKYAKEHDLTDLSHNRSSMRKARSMCLEDTPYGPALLAVNLVATPPHQDRDMTVVNPFSYLHSAFNAGGGFFRMLSDTLRSNPPAVDKPWRIAIYSDEVVPGNALAVRNARKVWMVYWSFLELHPHLGNEDAWIPLVAEPTESLKCISSGISQVFSAILEVFFGALTFDFSSGGMQLQGPDGRVFRIFATLAMFLQDGAAHRMVWGCKGDAGTRSCMLCKDLVTKASSLTDTDGTKLLVCEMATEERLAFATDADIRGAVKRVAAFAGIPKGEFKLRQQAIGFSYLQHGLLSNARLEHAVKPATQYCHDWMHALFCSGVFNIIVVQFMREISAVSDADPWSVVQSYVEKWVWPRSVNFDAGKSEHFSPHRAKAHKKAGHFKCSASDGRSLLPLLGYFAAAVAKRLAGMNFAACDALVALNDLVEALVAVNRGLADAGRVRTCVATMLTSCEHAQWQDYFIPKFHWTVHFAPSVEKFGLALTCWVHERKHKMVKRYASDICNTSVYSKSVLSEILSHQHHSVAQADAFDLTIGLIAPVKATTRLASFVNAEWGLADIDVYTSITARTRAAQISSKNDIVLIQAADGLKYVAAQLVFFAAYGEIAFACVNVWELVNHDTVTASAVWKMHDNHCFIDLESILCSVIWSKLNDEIARTLIPFEMRGLQAAK